MGKRLEGSVQDEVMDYLECLMLDPDEQAWFRRVAVMGRRGIPDIIGCYRGQSVMIECKRPGEEPKKIQWAEAVKITKAGGIYLVADNLDIVRDAIAILSRSLRPRSVPHELTDHRLRDSYPHLPE